MAIRVRITTSDESKPVPMDVEPEDLVGEMKESVAEFWGKNPDDYVIKKGVMVFSDDTRVSDADIQNKDELVLVHRAELSEATKEPIVPEVEQAKNWIFNEVGIPQQNLSLLDDSTEGSDRIFLFEDTTDNKKYKIVFTKNNEVKEYRPL